MREGFPVQRNGSESKRVWCGVVSCCVRPCWRQLVVGGTARNSKDVQQHIQKRDRNAKRGMAAFPSWGKRGEDLLFGGHAAGQGEG